MLISSLPERRKTSNPKIIIILDPHTFSNSRRIISLPPLSPQNLLDLLKGKDKSTAEWQLKGTNFIKTFQLILHQNLI